jgi:hypothetical protein
VGHSCRGGLDDASTAAFDAAARRRVRSALRDEVGRLAEDKHEREEMRIVREQLAELAPEPPV